MTGVSKPVAPGAVEENPLYRAFLSVFERFPGVADGQPMIDVIFENYALNRSATVDFMDAEGRPQVVCHADNFRGHTQVISKLVASIRRYGICQGVRGVPWAMVSNGGGAPYRMLAWGSLSRAALEALRIDPTNPLVIQSIKNGLRNTVLLHWKTPKDVSDYLRDFHNRWHVGAAKSWLDLLDLVPELDAAWQAHCAAEGISVRSCGKGADSYAGRNWSFIQEHKKDMFPSMEVYQSARAISNFLSLKGDTFKDAFRGFVNEITMFDDARINNVTVFKTVHAYITCLTFYEDRVDSDTLLLLLCEGVRFMLPSAPPIGKCPFITSGRETEWLLDKPAYEVIRVVSTEMGDSIVYNPTVNGKKRAAPAAPKVKPAKKTKTGTSSSVAEPLPEESLQAELETNGKKRMKQWLDDLIDAANSVIPQLPQPKADVPKTSAEWTSFETARRLRGVFYSVGLEFAWAKSATISGKTFSTWSSVRAALRELMHNASSSSGGGEFSTSAVDAAIQGLLSDAQLTSVEEAAMNFLLKATAKVDSAVDGGSAANTDNTEGAATPTVKTEPTVVCTPLGGRCSIQRAVPGDAPQGPDTTISLNDLLTKTIDDSFDATLTPEADMIDTEVLPTINIDSDKFNMSTLMDLCRTLEAALYGKCYNASSLDQYAHLKVDLATAPMASPSPVRALSTFPKERHMVFAGTVTLTRTPSSFAICVVESDAVKLKLFVSGDQHLSLSSEFVIPAWLCKPVAKGATLQFGRLDMQLRWQSAGCDVNVSVPVLTSLPECRRDDGEDFWATRPCFKKQQTASNQLSVLASLRKKTITETPSQPNVAAADAASAGKKKKLNADLMHLLK